MTDKKAQLRVLIEFLRMMGIDTSKMKGTEIKFEDGKIVETPLNLENKNSSQLIYEEVDIKLIDALQRWLESQEISQFKAMSCLAFALAHEIYYETESEDEGCAISTDYERFIHQTIHGMYQKYGPPKKKKDDLEK